MGRGGMMELAGLGHSRCAGPCPGLEPLPCGRASLLGGGPSRPQAPATSWVGGALRPSHSNGPSTHLQHLQNRRRLPQAQYRDSLRESRPCSGGVDQGSEE